MEIRIHNTREYLSKDILEEESLKSSAPIRILQKFFGTCRVDVRHRFVTSPTVWQKCYSILCIIAVIISHIHVICEHLYGYYNYQNVRFAATIWLCMFLLSNIFNLIHSRFLNGEANASFYIKLQKIDRIMKIDKNERINNFMFTINVITSSIVVVLLIISIYMSLAPRSYDLVGAVGVMYIDYSFLTELLHCSQNIYLFSVRLRFINCIMVNYLEGNPVRPKSSRGYLTKIHLLYIASLSHHFETCPIDVYLKELLNIFAAFRELYQFQVFVGYSRIIPLSVIGIYIIITSLKSNIVVPLTHCVIITGLSIFDMCLLVMLSVLCDLFLKETIKTKRLCTKVMALNYEGSIREKARKILIIIEKDPPEFKVYDMWVTNSHTFVSLINVITSLTITLLQFLFL